MVLCSTGHSPVRGTQTYVKRIHVLHDHFYKRVYGDEVGGKSDGSVDNTPVKESSGEQKSDGDKKKDCGGNYSGGSTSGNDDYPWKGYAEGPNPITGAYYVNCTDFFVVAVKPAGGCDRSAEAEVHE